VSAHPKVRRNIGDLMMAFQSECTPNKNACSEAMGSERKQNIR
jgi:hypothetical protein